MQGEFEAAIEPLEQALQEERTDDRLFQLAFTNLEAKKWKSDQLFTRIERSKSPISISFIFI